MYKKVERVSIKKTSPLCQFLEGDTPSGEFLHNLVATAGGPPPSAQVVCLRIESPNLIGCEIIVGHDSEPLVAWIDHVDGLGGDEDLRVVDVVLPGPRPFRGLPQLSHRLVPVRPPCPGLHRLAPGRRPRSPRLGRRDRRSTPR